MSKDVQWCNPFLLIIKSLLILFAITFIMTILIIEIKSYVAIVIVLLTIIPVISPVCLKNTTKLMQIILLFKEMKKIKMNFLINEQNGVIKSLKMMNSKATIIFYGISASHSELLFLKRLTEFLTQKKFNYLSKQIDDRMIFETKIRKDNYIKIFLYSNIILSRIECVFLEEK